MQKNYKNGPIIRALSKNYSPQEIALALKSIIELYSVYFFINTIKNTFELLILVYGEADPFFTRFHLTASLKY